jgi:hypothetical protein
MDEVPTASQIKKDARALYGALLSACHGGIGRRILMENRNKQDGIRAWYQLANQYETDGNRNVRIKKLENVITTIFHRHYKGGLFKWAQDYEDAFTELVLLGQTTWNDDDIKKRRLVRNAQNIGMVDTVFEALVNDKSFPETCNFLRSHAIRGSNSTDNLKISFNGRFMIKTNHICNSLFDFRPHCQRQQLEGCKRLLNDVVYDISDQMGLLA